MAELGPPETPLPGGASFQFPSICNFNHYSHPQLTIDNETLNFWYRRTVRARVSDNDAIELDNMPSRIGGAESCDSSADWVRDWLIRLGLGRYAPFSEIHEADDAGVSQRFGDKFRSYARVFLLDERLVSLNK